MVKYEELTVPELKKTAAYKNIPSFEKKSIAKKARLIELLKKYEKYSPAGRSPRRKSRGRRSPPGERKPKGAGPKGKSVSALRAECREQGLVYDVETKKCRESKRGKSARRSPRRASRRRAPSARRGPPPARRAAGAKRRGTGARTGDCISRSLLPLSEHQIRVARYLENHKGLIAVHGIGTGKTLTAVSTSQCFLDKFPDSKVIVISPAALVANFKKGMEEYGLGPDHRKYEFYSYEAFARRENVAAHCRDNLLIVDEAHNLRTLVEGKKGKKAAQALSCARAAGRILLLTATPFVNTDMDLNNLLALAKGTEPMTKSQWKNLMKDDRAREQYFRCMFSVYFREQGDANYPRRVDKEIELEMDDDYLTKYNELEVANEEKLQGMGIKNPWAFLSGLRIGLLKIENSAKINYVVDEAVQKVKGGRKVVIYSNFVGSGIKNVAAKLEARGVDFYEFTGKTSAASRKKYVEEYNSGEVRVLLITKAAGEGLDLKGTGAIFILDPPWNEAALEQAIGRAIRYKSHAGLPEKDRYVEVYTLFNVKPNWFVRQNPSADPSADSIIKVLIDAKREATKKIIQDLGRYSIENNQC